MKIFDQVKDGVEGNLVDASLVAGSKVNCLRYYEGGDVLNLDYLVLPIPAVANGFNDLALANGNVASLILPSDDLDVRLFGFKINDETYDSLPMLLVVNAIAVGDGVTTSLKRNVILPRGRIYVSDTFGLEREVSYFGKGGKVTSFNPHSSWNNASTKWVIEDVLLTSPGQGRPDNNFFGIRRGFGTRNDDDVTNIGCLWARCGGGSHYEDMYLADAWGAETLRVQGKTIGEGGDGGACVATTFSRIWLANTIGGDGTSRARNGLYCDNAFSTTFNNLVVDYQSNSVDYVDDENDLDGFGIKLNNCQVDFHSVNMEGNHKPITNESAQNCNFFGGSIYRKGLGAQTPSTDPDFICRNISKTSMPCFYNVRASLGYGVENGGGVGVTLGGTPSYGIVPRGDLATAAGGAFTYFSANYVNIEELSYLTNISTPLELTKDVSSVHMTPITRLYRSVYRTVYDEVVAGPGSGNIDIPLNAHGKLTITACRSDNSNQNRGDVYDVLYSGEDSSGQLSITNQLNDAVGALTFITGVTFIYTGGLATLRIAYDSSAYPFNLTVILDGRTKDNTDA